MRNNSNLIKVKFTKADGNKNKSKQSPFGSNLNKYGQIDENQNGQHAENKYH